MSNIKDSIRTDKTIKKSNIILAIIYFHQNFKININKDLIYEKFKSFEVKKIKIINQNESVKTFIELYSIESAEKIINLFHNTFDFYGKWKIYFSKKKKIIITPDDNKNYTETVYDDKISSKFSVENSYNINLLTPVSKVFNINTNSTFTPQIGNNIIKNNEFNFNKLSNMVINNYQNKKVIIVKKMPIFLKFKGIYNFFSLFGNIDEILTSEDKNTMIIYDDIYFEDRLRFLKFINIFSSDFNFEIWNLDDNYKNMIGYNKLNFKKKYNRYNKKYKENQTLIFPSNIVKIINIDNNLNIIKLYNLSIKKEGIKINKFKEVIRNGKKRYYFQFFDFLSTIKFLSIFHLKKVHNKKLYIQLSTFKIKL